MRRVLINHLLEPPGRVTGITRFMFALLSALLDVTQDSYVLLTCWSEQDLPDALLHPRLSIITAPFWKSTAVNAFLQNFVVRDAMRRTGADIELNVNPLGAWVKAWPRIITVHDLYLETMPEAYRRRHRLVWNTLFPLATRGADHIIVPSTSTKLDVVRGRSHLSDRIAVVPESASADSIRRAELIFEAVPETLRLTTLGEWRVGDPVNLERSLALGERLGGHLVQGHVDAVGEVLAKVMEGQGARLTVSLPASIAPLVAEKGSIAVDGVSLTVAAVTRDRMEIGLIPETLVATTLGDAAPGTKVNLEADVLARHVARLREFAPLGERDLAGWGYGGKP